jgi:hypothetical protein
LDKPLHVIYKARKLAYRILVILIANERVKKKDVDYRLYNLNCTPKEGGEVRKQKKVGNHCCK